MTHDVERTPRPEAKPPSTSPPSPQMTAEMPAKATGSTYPPAFAGGAGAAWIFRDLASI